MTSVYNAAEYCVDAIFKIPNFCITYDGLKILIQHSNQDIALYFNEKNNYDFIFSKFPEIFILKNVSVSLTDAYLSLICHKKSSKFASFWDVNFSAILYFLKILSLYGPQQYLNLFSALLNDRTQTCAEYFSHYTVVHAFEFFAANSQYFIFCNGIVMAAPSSLDVLHKTENEALGRLNKFVCFLLKCFKSLHYFVLSECISYCDLSCKSFLDRFSIIKQRQFFESIPDAVMDKYGFVSLSNKAAFTSFPGMHKMKLLIVCLLAFKKEMHFKDLIDEAIEKSKLSVVYFQRKSTDDHLMFFKKFPSNFIVSEDGFVKLLPTFTIPNCSFEDLSITVENTKHVVYTETHSKTIPLVHSDQNSISFKFLTETFIGSQNHITSNENRKKKKSQNKNFSVKPDINGLVHFLLKCFESLHYSYLKECISYEFSDCKKFFQELSVEKQQEYFDNIPNTVMDENGFLHLKESFVEAFYINRHKLKLLIIGILAFKKEMHFNELMNEAKEKSKLFKLSIGYCQNESDKDQLQFFKKFPSSFIVSEGGFVKLLPTFTLPDCCFKDVFTTVENTKQVVNTETHSKTIPSVHSALNNISVNSFLYEIISSQSHITSNANKNKKNQKKKKSPDKQGVNELEQVACSKAQHNDASLGFKELSKNKVSSPNPTLVVAQHEIISNVNHDKEPKHVDFSTVSEYSLNVPSLSETEGKKPFQRTQLNELVYFLLKCFESLHYLHLKECISYEYSSFKKFFQQLSAVKLREYFENIPHTVMDKKGFLCLKENFVEAFFSSECKMKLVIICILALKKVMHFSDLMYETTEYSKLSTEYYQNMSEDDQLEFLKKFPLSFILSEDGCVKLLTCLMCRLPECCFEDPATASDSANEDESTKQCNIVSSVCPGPNSMKANTQNQVFISSQITSDEKQVEEEKIIHIRVKKYVQSSRKRKISASHYD